MTSEGLGEMFEGDSADMCAGKFPLRSMWSRAEGLVCADPGARTPICVSGDLLVREIFDIGQIYLINQMQTQERGSPWAPAGIPHVNPETCHASHSQEICKRNQNLEQWISRHLQ